MKTENAKDLKRLAEHLRNGKLIHEKFKFTTFNDGEYDAAGCGTLGCALGECPAVFPSTWFFDKNTHMPAIGKFDSVFDTSLDHAVEFFNLDKEDISSLFCPESQSGMLPTLCNNATKEQVADNIQLFIEMKGFNYGEL